MSGICGVLYFDDQTVICDEIDSMLEMMRYRGQDAATMWIDGHIGLGHKTLWTTVESRHEIQPLVDPLGHLILAADARIDNRKELIDAFIYTPCKEIVTDADLILLAYQKWGDDCPKYLFGDYAFAIWDKMQNRLFCARDHLGMKPLYYFQNSKAFIFASEISVLFTHPLVHKRLDLKAVECSILFDTLPHGKTFFQDIFTLKRSNCRAIYSNGKHSTKEYWNPTKKQKIRDISYEEAASELKELLRQAIQCRLRSAYPIAFELSGGLDSSTVTAYSYQMGFDQSGFLYSLRFDDPSCDEGKYIDAVTHAVSQKETDIQVDRLDLQNKYSLREFYTIYPDWPMDLFFIPHFEIASCAKQSLCRVMLTGQGGDEVLQGSRFMFADFLRKGDLLKLAKELYGSPYKYYDFFDFTLKPLIPNTIRSIKKHFNSAKQKAYTSLYKYYLEEDIALHASFDLLASAHTAKMLWGTEHALWSTMNLYNNYGNFDIEVRHPLFDVKLIEFRLTTPSEYFYHNGTFKSLFRDVMKGILPEKIRMRQTKASFDTIIKKQLQTEIENNPTLSDIENLNIVQLLDPKIVALVKTHHAKSGFCDPDTVLHWKLINLEYWHQQNFGIICENSNKGEQNETN